MLQILMYRILHGLALSHLPTTISFPFPSPPVSLAFSGLSSSPSPYLESSDPQLLASS